MYYPRKAIHWQCWEVSSGWHFLWVVFLCKPANLESIAIIAANGLAADRIKHLKKNLKSGSHNKKSNV